MSSNAEIDAETVLRDDIKSTSAPAVSESTTINSALKQLFQSEATDEGNNYECADEEAATATAVEEKKDDQEGNEDYRVDYMETARSVDQSGAKSQASSITELYGTYTLGDSDSEEEQGNSTPCDTDATATSDEASQRSDRENFKDRHNSGSSGHRRRQTIFALLPLGRRESEFDEIDDDVIFDTVQYDFYTFVFIRQLLVHIFFFLYPFLLENPNAQGFGWNHRFQAHLYNWILPLCVYIMVASYFATSTTNREILSGAVYMPLILFLQHRTSVALKYAFLSNTEYKRFTDPDITTAQARKYQKQMQLITGWLYRNETVLEFELGAAATRIGAKVNEIHVVINSPLKSKSDYNQYHYWNAFMLGNELIDTGVDHAKEMVRLNDGSFAISVYDLSRAIISRADRCYEGYEALKETSLFTYLLINVSIPFFHIGYNASRVRVDAWLVLFVITSSIINMIFGYIIFSILYVAVFDVLRLWNMLWDANEIIRTSDALMTTGAVKKKRQKIRQKLKRMPFSSSKDSLRKSRKGSLVTENDDSKVDSDIKGGDCSVGVINSNVGSYRKEKKDIRSQHVSLERDKSMRVSTSIMTLGKENKLAQRSPDKLLIKHASLRDVPLYANDHQQQQHTRRAGLMETSDSVGHGTGGDDNAVVGVPVAEDEEERSYYWSSNQNHDIDASNSDLAEVRLHQPMRDMAILESPFSIATQQEQQDSPYRPSLQTAPLLSEGGHRIVPPIRGGVTFADGNDYDDLESGTSTSYRTNNATRPSRRVSWFRIGKVKEEDDEDELESSIHDINIGRHGSYQRHRASTSSSSGLRRRHTERPRTRSSGRDSVAEIGENIAENGAPALLPRVPIANTSNHQNIIAWTYTRLLLQHFGTRFRWRIDFNVAVTISLTVVLMVYALVLIFTAKDQRSEFLTSYFLQSLLAITIAIIYLWTFLCIGTLINRMMLFHSQSLAYYQSRVNRRLLLCEYLPDLEYEYIPLKSLRKFIAYAMDIVDASNTANPFRILGMDAVPSLTATVLTSAISFYGLVISLYLNAETDIASPGSPD